MYKNYTNIYNILVIIVIILLYVYVYNRLNKSNKLNNTENFQSEPNVEPGFFDTGNLADIVDLEYVSNPINNNILNEGNIPYLNISVTNDGQSCLEWNSLNNPAYENMKGNSCSKNWKESGEEDNVYHCLINKSDPTMKSCNKLIKRVKVAEMPNFDATRKQLNNSLKSKIKDMNNQKNKENEYLDDIIDQYRTRKDKISFLNYFIDRNKQIMSTNNNRISKHKTKFTQMNRDHNIDISKYNKANRQVKEKTKQMKYQTNFFKIACGIFILAIILNIWIAMK